MSPIRDLGACFEPRSHFDLVFGVGFQMSLINLRLFALTSLPLAAYRLPLAEDALVNKRCVTDARGPHARGLLLNGTFTPTEEARSLSTAPHLNNPHTPITARFSDAAGDPGQAETEAGNKPKGLAALAFFKASRDGALAGYLPAHPKARAFLKLPSPSPASFATARFFGVNAVKLVDGGGRATLVRYRVEPAAGVRSLSDEEASAESPTYLVDGVPGLIGQGPIAYRLTAQVAAEDDVTDDCTVRWPESRRVVELGWISLEGIVKDSDEEEKHIRKRYCFQVPRNTSMFLQPVSTVAAQPAAKQPSKPDRYMFDPLPKGVPGLEPSGDPLLDVRSLVYRMSARERGAL
ncbi:Catalase-related peroxidase [Cytospora mali]|uniref:Catalase-related peroxidase n=1 Tax=Cytospora mali TaxID=578113 RepID=A0A194VXR2_CYTMA|nr:Catalase-related peroxidase [Valsa mali]